MKKVLFTLIAFLTTMIGIAQASPCYTFPEGAFAVGLSSTGAWYAPNIYMPYSPDTCTWNSTTGAGTWLTNGKEVSSASASYSTTYKLGYSYYTPVLKADDVTYQYGGGYTGSSTFGRVYNGSGSYSYLTPARLFDLSSTTGVSQASSNQYSLMSSFKASANNKMGEFFNNTDVMCIDEITFSVTANKSGATVADLFPTTDAHVVATIYPAVIKNVDGKISNTADFSKPIASTTLTQENLSDISTVGAGVLVWKLEKPISIDGAFVIEVTEMKESGCLFYFRADKSATNTTSYYYNESTSKYTFPSSTSGYGPNFVFSVHAFFPALYKDNVETDTINAETESIAVTIHSNVDPKDVAIDMPDWITLDNIIYTSDKYKASEPITLNFKLAETTETREGTITIDNKGKKISYTVKQEAAAPAPDPVITFVSPVGAERSITVGLNAAGTVGVDWGDGVITEQTTTQAYDGWDGSVSFTGTPAGEGIVKIYADGLIYLGANGKFNEDKSDIPNGITSIDLTKAVDLEELLLNVNKLDSIDLSQNTKLTSLNIANNMFSDIDLSANTALTSLTANNNNFETLDISKNTALTTLYINANKFKAVDFTANTVLKSIYAQENEIESVVIGPNEAKGHTMNFSNNKLTSFTLADVANISTSYIYLRNNQLADSSVVLPTAVKRMWLDGNNFTLAGLYAYKAMATQTFTYATTFATEFAQAPLAITSEEGVIDLSAQAKLGESATTFTWITAANDTLVEGTDYTVVDGVFTFMTSNDSIRCYLTNAELPNFTAAVPYVTTWTSVTAAPALVPAITMTGTVGAERTISVGTKTVGDKVMLDWGDGKVIEQTISTDMWGDPAPAEFTGTPVGEGAIKIYGDAITYIEAVGKLTEGEILNAITAIDVTKATALEELYLNMNKLSSIDLSQNAALKTLNIASNLFETIDVAANPALASLTADANFLTSIDLSKNPALATVVLSNNQIAELDFSNNPLLKTATCLNNVLTSVNLGKNTAKNHTLQFGGNKLASISLEGLENFSGTYLRLRDNFFASADSIKLPGKIKQLWVDGNALNLVELYALKSKATTLTYATAGMFTSEFAQVPFALDETYPADAPVDLSSQAKLGEAATTFVWKNAAGDVLVEGVDYTVENGVFTFITANDSIRCYLSNAELANFTDAVPYVTTWISVQHATGIKNVNTTDMMNSNAIYNLNGVRVNKDYNGIIIRNGKRFINKK